MSWAKFRQILHFLAVIICSAAFIRASLALKVKNIMVSSLLMSFLLMSNVTGTLANYPASLFPKEGYERLAIAWIVLAVSFCLGTARWNIAFLCSAAAALCQVHDGMYAGALVILLWFAMHWNKEWRQNFWASVKKILPGFLCWCAIILMITLPPLLTGETLLSGREFVEKFARTQMAVHESPAFWGEKAICRQYAIWLVLFGFIYYILKKRNAMETKQLSIVCIGGIVIFSMVIILSMIFVDIIPVRFFAELFMPKFFRAGGLLLVFLLAYAVQEMFLMPEWRFLAIAMLLILPVNASGQAPWVLAAVLPALLIIAFYYWGKKLPEEQKIAFSLSAGSLFIAAIVLLYWYLKEFQMEVRYDWGKALFWSALLLSGFIIHAILYRSALKRRWMGLAVVGILFLNMCYCGYRMCIPGENGFHLKNSQYQLEQSASPEIVSLASFLREHSDKNALVLAEPGGSEGDKVAWFQVLSQRNVYVTSWAVSYNDAGIIERGRRLEELKDWNHYEADDFRAFMKKIGSKYILLDKEDKKKVRDSEKFLCLKDTATYALYRLQED